MYYIPSFILDCDVYPEFTRELMTLSYDIGNIHSNIIENSTKFDFIFKNVDLTHESYDGNLFKIK